MTDPILRASALEQAHLIRTREVTSEQIVRCYVERISKHQDALHPFVEWWGEKAIEAAKKCDAELQKRDIVPLPPFYGVPTGIKDINLYAGAFTRMGSRAYRLFWSPIDDSTSSAVKAGGFVVVGKLATSEFAALPVTEPDIHPPTRNPWNPDHSPGGSSGGPGCAVAARLLPIAQASDGAGSIRIPGSFCMLFGFKAGRGTLPNPFLHVDRVNVSAVGSLARSVDDAAAFMDVLVRRQGPLGDPAPPDSWLARARQPVPPGLRVRFTTHSPLGPTEPEIAATVHRVAQMLSEMGHHVEEHPMLEGSLDDFLPIIQAQISHVPVLVDSVLQPATRWLREQGKKYSDAAVSARQADLQKRIDLWFGDVDLWLTPTSPEFPPKIGAWKNLDGETTMRTAARLGGFTALFNISGQPAASVPVGLSSAGFPMGVQLAGKRGDDARVLAVSRALEHALGPMPVPTIAGE